MSVRRKLTDLENWMALFIGGGLLLIMVSLLLGALSATYVQVTNLILSLGVILLVGGIAIWLSAVQPWKNFDDWSTPLFTGHDHEAHEAHDVHQELAEPGVEEAGMEPVIPTTPTVPAPNGVDDLKIIEGIGPKIALALKNAGILTFADLAARQPDDVEHIVRSAGVRMVGHTNSLIDQAKLAAAGQMTELEIYQQQLRGQARKL